MRTVLPTRRFTDALPVVLLAAAMLLALSPRLAHAQGPEEVVVYREDFDDNQAQNWELEPGWAVNAGVLNGKGPAWARYTGGRWDGGRVTFTFWLVSLRGSLHANVRLSGTARYAVGLRYLGKEELSLYLSKQLGPESFSPMLAERVVPYIPNQRYAVAIVTQGGRIQVYLRQPGQESTAVPPVIEYADRDPLPPGTIAFEALGDSFAQVDEIIVTMPPIPTPTPTPRPTPVPSTPVPTPPPVSTPFTRTLTPPPPPTPAGPDLTVLSSDYWFEDEGRALVFSVGIANQGNAGAPGTTVVIRDEGGSLRGGSSPVPRLGPGGRTTIDVRLEIPDERRGTMHAFQIEVDPEERIRELDEDNNRQAVNIEMPPRGNGVLWVWIAVVLFVAAGAAFVAGKHAIRPKKIRVHVSPRKDAGTQQIESDGALCVDAEIRLKPIWDPGQQDIETPGPLVIDERRNV